MAEEKKKNKNLSEARKNKNDEFYTLYEDIEKEVKNYTSQFEDKIVYCNCDTKESNFYKYFKDNFNTLKLKKLIITGLAKEGEKAHKITYDGQTETDEELEGNGSFNSPECLAILNEVDIVCTNPPFSLFREYVKTLVGDENE